MITPAIWHGASIFLLVPAEEMSYFQKIVPKGIYLFGLQEVSEHTVLVVNQDFETFVSDAAPSSCLAMAAIGDDGYARLSQARDLFSRWSGNDAAPLVRASSSRAAEAVSQHLLTALLARYRSVSQQCVTHAGALSRLRANHEELQNNFAALEAFVVSSNVQPLKMTFNNPLSPESFLSVPGLKEVTQLMPTSTFALSSVDIYLGGVGGEKRLYGDLQIDLAAVEDGQVLARWQLQADEIAEGWTSLDVSKVLSGHQRTACLTIRTIGGIGDVAPLGLGPPQPLKAFRVQLTPRGPAPPNASLAMRCWSSLPGIAPPNRSKSISPTQALNASAIKRVSIPFTLLRDVEWVPAEWRVDVPPVKFEEAEKCIKCQASARGITLARLPEMSLPEISRVEARALVEDQEAPAVEFGMLFSDLPAEEVLASLQSSTVARNQLHFSGWIKSCGEPVHISSVIPVANVTGSIFLATRMLPESSNRSIQAAFRDLQVTLLGLSSPDQSGVYSAVGRIEKNGAGRAFNRLLAADDLRRVRTTQSKNGASQIRFDRITAEIKCDLSDARNVCAIIPDVRVKSPIHLSVKARANRSNAAAIRVGFAVSDCQMAEDAVLSHLKKKGRNRSPVLFSGWHDMHPSEEVIFELDATSGSANFVSLYMLAEAEPSSGKNVAVFSNVCVLEREQRYG